MMVAGECFCAENLVVGLRDSVREIRENFEIRFNAGSRGGRVMWKPSREGAIGLTLVLQTLIPPQAFTSPPGFTLPPFSRMPRLHITLIRAGTNTFSSHIDIY